MNTHAQDEAYARKHWNGIAQGVRELSQGMNSLAKWSKSPLKGTRPGSAESASADLVRLSRGIPFPGDCGKFDSPHLRAARHACRLHRDIVGALLLVLLLAATARAQDVGSVAELEGTVELGRGGTWIAVSVGMPVMVGDELRTSAGRFRVVFQDGSVLTAADNTQVRIDEQVFDAKRAVSRSLLRLVQGKIRAVVSEYYERPRSFFQIETTTAVSGVRGTEFVIAFDPVAEVTEVVGVSGRAEVHSVLDPVRHGVIVRAKELTTVKRGKFPTPPRRISDELFRQYLENLEFVGGGKLESLTIAIPLATGNVVPEPDRAASVPGSPTLAAGEEAAQPRPVEPKLISSVPVLADDITQRSQGAGGLLHDSPTVIESTSGQLGIRF